MANLNKSTISLLKWLSNNNVILQCTQAGRVCGDISQDSRSFPTIPRLKTSLNNLIINNLVDEHEIFEYGIRWSCFKINKKGIAELKKEEVNNVLLN